MYYELTLWSGLVDNQGQYEVVLVRIEELVIDSLLSDKPPRFIKVLIEDGEMSIINTSHINRLREVFGGNPQGE